MTILAKAHKKGRKNGFKNSLISHLKQHFVFTQNTPKPVPLKNQQETGKEPAKQIRGGGGSMQQSTTWVANLFHDVQLKNMF